MPHLKTDRISILLFEDNQLDANLVSEYLELVGLESNLVLSKRLEEGLEQARTGAFDVILLDLSLPDSRGIDTLKAIREVARESVVIVLTGSEDDALSLEALQAGAQDYLFKDKLNAEVLRRSIQYSIERANLVRRLDSHAADISNREALLRHIFDANTDAMLILTAEHEIRFFNPAAAALLDADEESLVGETFPFEVCPSQVSELEIPDASGASRLVELSAVDLVWEKQRGLLVILRDITQRRAAEIELRRGKERLAVILDSITDGVIATDQDNRVEKINQMALQLIGLAAAEAIGRPIEEVLKLSRLPSREIIEDPIKALLHSESEGLRRDDVLQLTNQSREEPTLVAAETRSLPDESGTPHGYVTVLRDKTKQKQIEEELFKNEKLNSINLLASGIAHDFNNILSAILGNISVVRLNIDENHPSAKPLLAAETAALQAKSLTQQLLTFSKGGSPSLEVTSIDQLVEESAQFILRGSNVKCNIEKESPLWAANADKGQISQVINNLIINADQAMPSGGIIAIRLNNRSLQNTEVPSLKAGDYICIEVEDSGVGISPEDLNRIFDPYFTTKKDGNGLGLASSYSIITGHNGAITVQSEQGKGTSFCVFLPRAEEPEEPEAPMKPESLEPVAEKPARIHKGKGRILVMDDMEAMMTVAGEILRALGYEVEFSTNGQEAIDAYKRAKESGNPFDAVVFDLTVPGGMGGEEASEILIKYDPNLIAIASSGYTTSNVMSDYKSSAFKAVVPKPYRIKEMSDALERILS